MNFLIFFFNYGCFLGKGNSESSDKKDQEITVVSPPPEESIGQSSGSTPTLPYSHGQANFSGLIPPSSSIPISSLPFPQIFLTIPHFNPSQLLFLFFSPANFSLPTFSQPLVSFSPNLSSSTCICYY